MDEPCLSRALRVAEQIGGGMLLVGAMEAEYWGN